MASEWRKILYQKQQYPDNYVDETFLNELKKNLFVQLKDYKSLVLGSVCITQQVTSVCLFVTMFVYMEDHSVSPQALWVFMSLLTLGGYLANLLILAGLGLNCSSNMVVQHIKTCLLLQGFSATFSPVLVSLTETVSTDTIYAMTTVMLLGNLLCYNYRSDQESVPGALSLNAAIFASVCLASRLHTAWHAFSLVTASLELFALWPLVRRNVKMWSPRVDIFVSLVMAVACLCCLLPKSPVAAILYGLVVLFITLVCPAWMYQLQQHKNNIHGPWDEATPT